MSFSQWILAHSAWKAKLADYIAGKSQEKLDPGVVEREDLCQLGKWILEHQEKLGSDPDFAELRELHRAFHLSAGRIIREVDSGNRAAAGRLLSPGGAFVQNSIQVVSLISGMRNRFGRDAA